MSWQNENVVINWTDRSIEHIAKHEVEPYEVEEGLLEDDPKIESTQKDRRGILCQTITGRYITVIVSYPPEDNTIRIITARDMTKREKRRYRNSK